jgi:hypothetical protein
MFFWSVHEKTLSDKYARTEKEQHELHTGSSYFMTLLIEHEKEKSVKVFTDRRTYLATHKMPRDWQMEREQLAEAFTELEIMKLWLLDHVQSAPLFTEEFKRLNARLGKLGQIDEEGMINFHMGIDRERWQQFSEACNVQAGRELSPAEVETRAKNLWSDAIDAIIEHYNQHEGNKVPVILTIWAK